MSIPSWWSDAILEPGDSSITGIVDVETGGVGIITELRLRLVTNGNWTEPSANLFKSPVTAAGRFFDMLFTRIDADTMEVRVRDHLAATLYTRRFNINVAPATTTVEFYWGNNYLWIWSRMAAAELCFATLLDPEVVGGVDAEVANRVYGYAQRTTGDVATALTVGAGFCFDNGVATNAGRSRPNYYLSTANATAQVGPGVRELYRPITIFAETGSVRYWVGAIPGVIMAPSATVTDAVRNIPVDTGTKMAFICMFTVALSTYGGRWLIRKPSVDP